MKATYRWLALIGVVFIAEGLYFQSVSVDLSRYRLMDYLTRDVAIPAWWHVIAAPFLVGLAYVIAGCACLLLSPTRQVALAVVIVCFMLALALCLLNLGVGLLASVMVGAVLLRTLSLYARAA